jgi:hypothetical protein
MVDPYTTLGVTRHANAAEIRHAYRVLAARVHPDLQPAHRKAWAHAEMVRLNAARMQLLSPHATASFRQISHEGLWPSALGLWLCFVISILLPFVAFSPEASQMLIQIVAMLTSAALSLGLLAFTPLILSLGVAIFVARTFRSRA